MTTLRRIVVVIVILTLLAFNIASFAVAPLADAMLDLTRWTKLTPAVASSSDLATLRTQISDLRSENRKLGTKARRLEQRAVEAETLASQRATRNRALARDRRELSLKVKSLTAELEEAETRATQHAARSRVLERRRRELSTNAKLLASKLETSEARIARQLEDVDRVTARIARRATRNAARNVASLPMESLPVFGAVTMAGVTALELRDACRTVSDMDELRKLTGMPPSDPDLVSKTCALVAPQPALPSDMTIQQCRAHAENVRTELGEEAGDAVEEKCDCLELPDGCPTPEARNEETPPVPLP